MSYYVQPYQPDELYHFGVKGMRWGVRRYENYDGTYTKAGLKRYKESDEGYDFMDQTYKMAKDGRSSKAALKSIKNSMKAYKKQMKADYKQLKRDKLADEGKKQYAQGKRITTNVGNTLAGVVGVGGFATSSVLAFSSDNKLRSMTPYVAIGSTVASAALGALGSLSGRKLRAYYGHNRPSDANRLDDRKELQKAIDTKGLRLFYDPRQH